MKIETTADFRTGNRRFSGLSGLLLRPLRGRNQIMQHVTGGVAALSPRLMASTPSGSNGRPALKTRAVAVLALLLVAIAATAIAQRGPFGQRGRIRQRSFNPEDVDRGGLPVWTNEERFQGDVFTFVRIKYSSYAGGWGGGGRWAIDYPDSDLNFSYRLHELTA